MNKIPLMENACKDLLQYGVFDERARAKYLIKTLLLQRRAAWEDLIFWPTGLLAAGLWHCRCELMEKRKAGDVQEERLILSIETALTDYYARWRKKGMPVLAIDDLLAGETLLDAYMETEAQGSDGCLGLSMETMLDMLGCMADYATKAACDAKGSLLYRPGQGNAYIFADTIGLCCPFLFRYGEFFKKQEYRELALKQIDNFLSYGMDSATGLPYHGYDLSDGGCKYGIIGWGRAVGWLLRGMSGCLFSDYGRQHLETSCRELVDAVLSYQRVDGFHWQLQAFDGPMDTSATAMICAAIKRGMAYGCLSGAEYEKALSSGGQVLSHFAQDGLIWHSSAECEGFSCYPQRYGTYPWALGPALEVL